MSALIRVAISLVRAAAPRELGDELEGDLRELYERRRCRQGRIRGTLWLLLTSVGMAASFVWSRTPFAHPSSFLTPPLPAARRGVPVSITDFKLAVRLLVKQPVLSATAIVALGVAMVLATTGFTFINATMFAELPFPDGDRFVYVDAVDSETGQRTNIPQPVLDAWSREATTLRGLGVFGHVAGNLELRNATPVAIQIAHDSRILVRSLQTLEQVGWESRALLRSVSLALAALGLMALALSVAGIYAIMAFSVQQRTREIGVRVALGADPGDILRGVLGLTSLRLLSGAALGAGMAVVLAKVTVVLA